MIGTTVERYVVEAELGAGGMATVYRVRHRTLDSLHALKVLKVQSAGIRQRLVQEGRVQATLRHPNIVAVTDVVDVDGAPGLVMELVDGPSLEGWLHGRRPSLAEAETIFRGILAGVARAHRNGLVHRDLKPGNVLLDFSGDDGLVPKVTDFGLAKILDEEEGSGSQTRSGVAMGTPAYMAPEQARSAKDVDQRADIFALGCILYELVSGHRPFAGDDVLATLNAVTRGEYAPLDPAVPERVRATVTGCLEVDRERRVPDCAGVRSLFFAGELPVEPTDERPPAPPVPAIHPAGDSPATFAESAPEVSDEPGTGVRGAVWLLLAVLVSIAAGAAWTLTRSEPGPAAATPVELPASPAPPVAEAAPVEEPPSTPSAPAEAPRPTRGTGKKVARIEPDAGTPPPAAPEEPPAAVLPASGTVRVAGDVAKVRFVNEAGSFPAGTVPAGTYTIRAEFAGRAAVSAGHLNLHAGEEITLSCDAEFQMCRAR